MTGMTTSKLRQVAGQASWNISADRAEAFITRDGGHIAPVTFKLGNRKVSPLNIAPWAEEKHPAGLPTMLRVLRGDFFCMPFGGNDVPWRSEQHPPHGDTANLTWQFVSTGRDAGRHALHLRLATRARSGQVDKHIVLRDGHTAVYQRHAISGMSGPMSFGHHAMVAFPDEPESGLVATSPIAFGRTTPVPFEHPEQRGYAFLQPDTPFKRLDRVPALTGQTVDLTRYPARRGWEDLVMLVNKPRPLAWSAVTFPGRRYVWFALKDPAVLPATILWLSNGGRHYAPWNGRHVNVMGIEEVCSYFHYGLAESVRKNPVSDAGVPTFVRLNPRRPTVINYIIGVAAVPATFRHVRSIEPTDAGIRITDTAGQSVETAVDVDFLRGGNGD